MHTFQTLAEAEAELAKHIPAVRELLGKDVTLERMLPLMERLGNPQNKLKIIHIAGTSGKTSTAYYTAKLLEGDGRKVGLTVSPHIDSVTERIQINGTPLDERSFCDGLAEFLNITKDVQPEPTYFELLVAFVYWYFAKVGVDYAVIETGLGGLHDGTNVIDRADKVCVITDIGYDHMHVLGKTLESIATQKAGIILPDNKVLMYKQPAVVADVFTAHAQKVGADLALLEQENLAQQYDDDQLHTLPLYQQRNWLLARQVCEYVAKRDEFSLVGQAVTESLRLQVPGRMDTRTLQGKTVVMDGAHNEQKMTAFVQSFRQKYPGQRATVLLSLKQGKEYEAVLPLLLPMTDQLIVTTFDAMQDLQISSHDVQTLEQAAKDVGFEHVQAIKDSREAYQSLMASQEDLLVVTGSFYLVALVREYMKEEMA